MEKIILKNSNDSLELTKFCLGNFVSPLGTDEVTEQVYDRYFENYNLIDSARIYGNFDQDGSGGAEAFLGSYLKKRGLLNKAVIVTKGGHPYITNMTGDRLDKASLVSDINESLKYLQRDYIDVYMLHRDSGRDVYEVMSSLNQFVKEGKVRFLGASNWSVERILEANAVAEKEGFAKFEISQIAHSLAKSSLDIWGDPTVVVMNDKIEQDYINAGIPVMAFSSQAKGFFSKLKTNDYREKVYQRYHSEGNLKIAEKVFELAEKYNVSISSIALRYLIDSKLVVVPIISASKLYQFEEALDVEKFKLTAEDMAYLNS